MNQGIFRMRETDQPILSSFLKVSVLCSSFSLQSDVIVSVLCIYFLGYEAGGGYRSWVCGWLGL